MVVEICIDFVNKVKKSKEYDTLQKLSAASLKLLMLIKDSVKFVAFATLKSYTFI